MANALAPALLAPTQSRPAQPQVEAVEAEAVLRPNGGVAAQLVEAEAAVAGTLFCGKGACTL